MLIRVAAALDSLVRQAVLVGLDQVADHRLLLRFETTRRRVSVTISLWPDAPWCGIAPGRREGRPAHPARFTAAAARALRGEVVERLGQCGFDRALEIRFVGGRRLLAELGAGPNLVLLDPHGRVEAVARPSRAARRRLRPGEAYRARPLPAGRLVPLNSPAERIDEVLEAARAEGLDRADALRSRVFGLGTETVRQVVEECRATGRSPGDVLSERLRGLVDGSLDPVLLGHGDPRRAAESGEWDRAGFRLLPWSPLDAGPREVSKGEDPARTVGAYHDAAETAAVLARRLQGLRGILERERRRVGDATVKARGDLAGFENPERYRRWGEALLAGLHTARRAGDAVLVPDPYDPQGAPLRVPAPPALPLAAVADRHFRGHRRARRGLEAARSRLEQLRRKDASLEALTVASEAVRGLSGIRELEERMRAAGIPVELAARPGRRGIAPAEAKPRVEGVRMFTSSDGWTILVGRGGRENHRLTFGIASAEDFWLHALGCPGAHVVLRNPERRGEPPERSLREAAALAARFSDAREQSSAEVQWTRRKYVRKPRNAKPGTVLLKRFRTIAVRPGLPPERERTS